MIARTGGRLVRTVPPGRRFGAALAAALFAILSMLAVAAPASAHVELTGSSPGANSTIETVPEEITLRFSSHVSDGEVIVTSPEGQTMAYGSAEASEDEITQTIDLEYATAGMYSVSYRVVAEDGHPIMGRFTFQTTQSVATGEAGGTEGTDAATEPSGVPTDATDSSGSSDPGTDATQSESQGVSADDEGGVDLLVVAVPVVLIGAALVLWLLSRRKRSATKP